MIFYGDRWQRTRTRRLLAGLTRTCEAVEPLGPGLDRREGLTRLLLEAGELAQGLADEGFRARGYDELHPTERRSAELVLEVARALREDVDGARVSLDGVEGALEELSVLALPEHIGVDVSPKGYAFHALYPELYLAAGRALRGSDVVVIGLRSIGTSLAAVVAAGAGATTPPVTLRPAGHPFHREVRVSPALERLLLARASTARYAVVDEGPGLSGSSFGAVADWLEARGVSPERLHFFPSHRNGPGPRASEAHRHRWDHAVKHVCDFEPGFLAEGGSAPPEDVGAGRWRARVYPDARDWPAADVLNERRKYLLEADGRTWLAKFAGLGRHGVEKLERARVMEQAGLHPRVRGLTHGFLVTEWLETARPFGRDSTAGRSALLHSVGDYLALIVRELPARGEGELGATPRKLLEMARVNTEQALGRGPAGALERWRGRVDALAERARPVATDNRMHPWEWLWREDGRVVKVDALDHAAGPDFIGEQDIAWDVAGATVELELHPAELRPLLKRLGPSAPDTGVLRFYLECYLAFQLGAAEQAAQAIQGLDAAEGQRLTAARDWYAVRLRRLLENVRVDSSSPVHGPSSAGV